MSSLFNRLKVTSVQSTSTARVARYWFTVTAGEFQSIAPDLSKCKPVLSGEWRDLFYDKFYVIYPSCPVLFTYCRVRKAGSRKRNSPFFRGSAICKDCIKADFVINDDPQPDTDVRVEVTVTGSCTHSNVPAEGVATETTSVPSQRRGRRLTGTKRMNVARGIVSGDSTASQEYYAELSAMPDDALRAGNTAPCHTQAVF